MLTNALREGESGGSLYLHVSKKGGGPGTGTLERIRTQEIPIYSSYDPAPPWDILAQRKPLCKFLDINFIMIDLRI